MIILDKPPREDAIAQELRAAQDKKREEQSPTNKNRRPYWIIVSVVIGITLALLLYY